MKKNGNALVVTGVTKRFGTLTAVDNVSLTVPVGQIVALLGPNGAGKTTLLDMVLGFTEPASGSISVMGQMPREAATSGDVGAVLQTRGLLDDLTASETLRMVASCHRHHLPIADVMERAGVTEFAKTKVGKCSGGQVQRLRFALALLTDPQLLILDEPTAGMDASARRDFWHTMHAEAERGRTVVFATHYLQEADDYADRVILMRQGHIVADGTVAEMTATQDRIVEALWLRTDLDPAAVVEKLNIPSWSREGKRVRFTTADSDALARHLLTENLACDLEISRPSMESVFFELTETAHEGAQR
ncbi:MAG: ABC transporter ATP-binding protein [Ancrocorticia sp.]